MLKILKLARIKFYSKICPKNMVRCLIRLGLLLMVENRLFMLHLLIILVRIFPGASLKLSHRKIRF